MIDPFIDQMNRAIVTIDSMNVVCARRGDRLRLNEEPRFFYWIYRLERKELVIDCIGIRELCC